MKTIIFAITLFAASLYSQEIAVKQTDGDHLYQDLKFMYSEINTADCQVLIVFTANKKYIIIDNSIACDWSDIEQPVREKLMKRRDEYFKNHKQKTFEKE